MYMTNLKLRGFGRDAKLLISAMSISSLGSGFSQVAQSIFLAMLGFSPALIGVAITVATVSSALRMVFFGVLSDKVGRRVVLSVIYITSAINYMIYFFAQDYLLFLLAAIIGGISAVSAEGYGGAVEHAYLCEKVGESKRTMALTIQYFFCSGVSALGTFSASLPNFLTQTFGIQILFAIRLLFALQAILGIVSAILVFFTSEDKHTVGEKEEIYLSTESRKKIVKFSVYTLLDGFGTGMIYSLFSLWFYLRFGISITIVGYIFTASKVLETFAYLLGPVIAAKHGLLRTQVMVRFAGAISVFFLAFMPTYLLAALIFSVRNAIQHISNPLRISYTIAIFNRNERASAESITSLANIGASSAASSVSGYLMQFGTTTSPLISSVIVGLAQGVFYILFRDVKPPEEQKDAY
jgi:MFS family permease